MYEETDGIRSLWANDWVRFITVVLVASLGIVTLVRAVTVNAHDIQRMVEQGKYERVTRYIEDTLQSPKRAELVALAVDRLLQAEYAETMAIVKDAINSEQIDKTVLVAMLDQLRGRRITPFESAEQGLNYYLSQDESMPAGFAPTMGQLLLLNGTAALEQQLLMRLQSSYDLSLPQAAALARHLDKLQLTDIPLLHELAQIIGRADHDSRRIAELERTIEGWERQVSICQARVEQLAAEANGVFTIDCCVHSAPWNNQCEIRVPVEPGTKAPTQAAYLLTKRSLKQGEWYQLRVRIKGTVTRQYSEQFGSKTEVLVEYEELERDVQAELEQAQAELNRMQSGLLRDQDALLELQSSLPTTLQHVEETLCQRPVTHSMSVPSAVKAWAQAYQPALLGTRLQHGNYTYLLVTGGAKYHAEIVSTEVVDEEIVVRASFAATTSPNYAITVIPKTNMPVSFQSVTDGVFLGTLDGIPQEFRPIWSGPKVKYQQAEPHIVIGSTGKQASAGNILIESISLTFESTVMYALLDKDGKELARHFFTPHVGTGWWRYFSLEVPEAGVASVKLFEESAKDGSEMNVVVVTP